MVLCHGVQHSYKWQTTVSERTSQDAVHGIMTDNCVRKDKSGNCPWYYIMSDNCQKGQVRKLSMILCQMTLSERSSQETCPWYYVRQLCQKGLVGTLSMVLCQTTLSDRASQETVHDIMSDDSVRKVKSGDMSMVLCQTTLSERTSWDAIHGIMSDNSSRKDKTGHCPWLYVRWLSERTNQDTCPWNYVRQLGQKGLVRTLSMELCQTTLSHLLHKLLLPLVEHLGQHLGSQGDHVTSGLHAHFQGADAVKGCQTPHAQLKEHTHVSNSNTGMILRTWWFYLKNGRGQSPL